MSDKQTAQPAAAKPEGYGFVMNVGRLVDNSSYTLAPGYELRRATPTERTSIRELFNKLVGTMPLDRAAFLWERSSEGGGGVLDENEWRYFVISFSGTPQTYYYELLLSFELAPTELEVAFTFHTMPSGGQGFQWHEARLFHVVQAAMPDCSFFTDVSARDVKDIQVIHSQLQNPDRTLLDVQSLAAQLGQLKGFPHSSPLRFLGYFAILESVLTHAPKPSDPYDSITRQVKKKLALLNHRFPRKIDYSAFGGASEDTVWARMYAYRSELAHGGHPEFTGDLRVLVSHNAALVLVKETVKAVIRQALSEPQLLVDLRDC